MPYCKIANQSRAIKAYEHINEPSKKEKTACLILGPNCWVANRLVRPLLDVIQPNQVYIPSV